MTYFLIGILGTGMCSLANVLYDLGESVVGSDFSEPFFTTNLLRREILVLEFNKNNIHKYKNATFIISHAYNENLDDVKEVFANNYSYFYYSTFIEMYFSKPKIGVCGTHGKTTTVSLLRHLLQDKVSTIIGDGTGSGNKEYQYLLLEACEYQNHFLNYTYDYLVINNIDFDHSDYFKNITDVVRSFKEVINNTKNLIINSDDCNLNGFTHPNLYTFSLEKEATLKGEIIEKTSLGTTIKITIGKKENYIVAPIYGKHMVYNLLASLTVFYIINKKIDFKNINRLLCDYIMPQRRMQEYKINDYILINDYAHHPTEISCFIQSVVQKYNQKVTIIFIPHTYSRTISLKEEFKKVFQNNDSVYICPTFSSKREIKNDVLEQEVQEIFRGYKHYDHSKIENIVSDSKIICIIGAGNNHLIIEKIISFIKEVKF